MDSVFSKINIKIKLYNILFYFIAVPYIHFICTLHTHCTGQYQNGHGYGNFEQFIANLVIRTFPIPIAEP